MSNVTNCILPFQLSNALNYFIAAYIFLGLFYDICCSRMSKRSLWLNERIFFSKTRSPHWTIACVPTSDYDIRHIVERIAAHTWRYVRGYNEDTTVKSNQTSSSVNRTLPAAWLSLSRYTKEFRCPRGLIKASFTRHCTAYSLQITTTTAVLFRLEYAFEGSGWSEVNLVSTDFAWVSQLTKRDLRPHLLLESLERNRPLENSNSEL